MACGTPAGPWRLVGHQVSKGTGPDLGGYLEHLKFIMRIVHSYQCLSLGREADDVSLKWQRRDSGDCARSPLFSVLGNMPGARAACS